MHKARLEAFSDGVIAIIITIMVLELEVPHEPTLEGLRPLLPVFLSYVLSFIYVGIYWNNHHHMLQAAQHVTGGILWANLHLLFWLSLLPFGTAWIGENHFEPAARCVLRVPAADVRGRLYDPEPRADRAAWARVGAGASGRQGRQGPRFARDLRLCPAARLRQPAAVIRAVRRSRHSLAGAGPAHRKKSLRGAGFDLFDLSHSR